MVKFVSLPLVLMLLLAQAITPACAAVDPDDLVREAVNRLGLQTEMPEPGSGSLTDVPGPQSGPQNELPASKPGSQAGTPDTSAQASDDSSRDSSSGDNNFSLHLSPDVVRILLWGAVIVGTLVIAWSLRDSLPVISRSRKIIAPEPAAPAQTPSGRMEEAQLEADDLARQGHYRLAMHVLLLQSLDEIRRQLGTRFAVSLTSREILRRVQLSDLGRRSLTSIIRSVERTYFGSDDAGQGDYAACRHDFETLKHSLAIVVAA
jgi:hypothetical protein